jgi:hypothetical protein
MEFQKITQLASIFSKNYARDVLRLLIIYQDISASEVASRLNLHIKTAQDFLEELCLIKIVQRKEVFEKKGHTIDIPSNTQKSNLNLI